MWFCLTINQSINQSTLCISQSFVITAAHENQNCALFLSESLAAISCTWNASIIIIIFFFGGSVFHLLIDYFMGQCRDKHLSASTHTHARAYTQRLMGPVFVSWAWLAWTEHMGWDGGRWRLSTLQRVWMTALETRKTTYYSFSAASWLFCLSCVHWKGSVLCITHHVKTFYLKIRFVVTFQMMMDCSESVSDWINRVLGWNADVNYFNA